MLVDRILNLYVKLNKVFQLLQAKQYMNIKKENLLSRKDMDKSKHIQIRKKKHIINCISTCSCTLMLNNVYLKKQCSKFPSSSLKNICPRTIPEIIVSHIDIK